MQDQDMFLDSEPVKKVSVKIITPYRKLRKQKKWSIEKAAEVFSVSRKSLIDFELGRRDPPKQLVRMMDKEYNCGGQLIGYWLTKFSYGEPPPTVIDKAVSFFRRWFYGSTDKS